MSVGLRPARRSWLGAALLACAVLSAGGCSRQEEYPQAVRDEFMKECLAAAKGRLAAAVPDAAEQDRMAKAYCECSLERTMKAFSLKEFSEVENVIKLGARLDAATGKKLAAAITECQALIQIKK
jgi:hypothetical protein